MHGSKRLALAAVFAVVLSCAGEPAEDTRPRGPLPRSENEDGRFRVALLYFGDTEHRISSITATGPGPGAGFEPTTVELAWAPDAWGAVVDFAAGHPPEPTSYDFAITEGGITRHEAGVVPCYLELATPLAPAAGQAVTSPVTFRWTPLGSTAVEYAVYAFGGGRDETARVSVVDRDTLTVALPVGTYSAAGTGYRIDAVRVGGYEPASPHRCVSRASGPEFQVVPP